MIAAHLCVEGRVCDLHPFKEVLGIIVVRVLSVIGAMLALTGPAFAGPSVEPVNLYSVRAITQGPVAAIKTNFEESAGKKVRIAIYDSEENFLESPRARRYGKLGENGFALISLKDLEPGEYSLAAYVDVNGDGRLNRGSFLGRPKEPVAFSNGVTPKLRKPRFDETKVVVDEDSIVVITLDD